MAVVWSRSTEGVDWEELVRLYAAAPLGNKDAAGLELSFANSMFVCFASDEGRLIGVGRAVADGVDCAYICDIAVHPSHQGTGVGKAVLTDLLDSAGGHKKIILYSVPGAESFYRKFGFKRMTTAMAIFEDQDRALASGLVDDS